ncbi:phage terminase small subunit [Micromonospora zhanjiangensis]|uniref:Terminase small subunit n=1 Tax=Micromonospora zhanjiangensis TaxID=1522057 RepID=A0ABV8KNX7_9ACTN
MPALPKRNPARRNKSATRATLSAAHSVKAPELPPSHDWHPATVAWWRDIWASPMAPEYDESDVHGLLILAVLVDEFWTAPSKDLAGEIRLQRQCFGLTPIDRRRLQWEIERTDEAQEKGRRRRTGAEPGKAPTKARDPRAVLRSVS